MQASERIEHKDDIAHWARLLMRLPFVVIDTETTGLDETARIVSIAVIDREGRTLIDTLVNPECHIPAEATGIHGLNDADVAGAPTFSAIYPMLRRVLQARVWVGYNIDFDARIIRQDCERCGLPVCQPARLDDMPAYEDAMTAYAQFYGAFSSYHGNYKWQKLTAAADQCGITVSEAHHARADALTTLEVIRYLARY